MRRPLALGLLAFATACGSTVQVSSTRTAGTDLAAPGTADGVAPAPGAVDPARPLNGTTMAPRSTSTADAPVAAGGDAPARGVVATAVGVPGVTSTTITVGVIATDPSADQTLEGAGFGAAATGNEPASWRAAADEVNARGGVAGRRLQLVFHLINLTEAPAVQGQAACTAFTQDHKVAVVLSGYYYPTAHVCLSQRGVPVLLGTNYGVDSQAAQQNVVAWATPLLDRIGTVLPGAFQRLGRLTSGTTAGIFTVDSPTYRRGAARLGAELTRRGVKVVTQTIRDSDTGDYSGMAGDASAAVLQFKAAGVTEVLFVSRNAAEPALLMQAANSQGWRPTYLLSTQQYPAALIDLAPPGQLDGSVAVGWAPAIDLTSGYDSTPQAQRCLTALKKRGRTFESGTQTLVGLLACDGVDLLRRASSLSGAFTDRAALLRAAVDRRTGFVSAVTIRTAFPSGRRDGVAAYRPMAFDDGCTCFRYTGPVSGM